MAQSFIVFDLEFTAWPGSMERAWKGPGEHREVIHIGAVELSGPALEETAVLDLLVRPRINPVLSDYIIALTGITNDELARRGLDLAEALPRFLAFAAGRPIVCFGRDDLVLIENAELYGLQRMDIPTAVNIGPWLRANGIDTKGLHACDTARAAGVAHDTRDHNAVEDSRSVAKAIRALIAKGAPMPNLTA